MKLFLLLTTLSPLHDGSDEVTYVDASLEREGELLGYHFVDVDQDDVLELVLVRRPETSPTRELSVHRITPRGVEVEPFWSLEVLDDAVAYGFADVREEPGRELLFLARRGVWSMSLDRVGYRDNLQPLIEHELLYDVPDPTSLRAWRYVFEGEAGDRLLLPGRASTSTFAPTEDRSYHLETTFSETSADRTLGGSRSRGREMTLSSSREVASASDPLPWPFLAGTEAGSGDFLESERSLQAPTRLHVDRDGREDLVRRTASGIAIHLQTESGFRAEPDRVEEWPAYLEDDVVLELVDLDGDGDTDVVAVEDPDGGVDNDEIQVFALRNDGARLLPEKPHQVLRFEAAEITVQCADIDGDGRVDLALRKFEMPSLLDAVSGLEFTLTHLLFRGEEGKRPFERKPVVKTAETFDEKTFETVVKRRVWRLDCSGDGLADVVEIDLQGRISMRRLLVSKSFFGGESWEIEATPWRRFPTTGNIEEVEVRDLNGDGLADVVSETGSALTILLSSRRGNR